MWRSVGRAEEEGTPGRRARGPRSGSCRCAAVDGRGGSDREALRRNRGRRARRARGAAAAGFGNREETRKTQEAQGRGTSPFDGGTLGRESCGSCGIRPFPRPTARPRGSYGWCIRRSPAATGANWGLGTLRYGEPGSRPRARRGGTCGRRFGRSRRVGRSAWWLRETAPLLKPTPSTGLPSASPRHGIPHPESTCRLPDQVPACIRSGCGMGTRVRTVDRLRAVRGRRAGGADRVRPRSPGVFPWGRGWGRASTSRAQMLRAGRGFRHCTQGVRGPDQAVRPAGADSAEAKPESYGCGTVGRPSAIHRAIPERTL